MSKLNKKLVLKTIEGYKRGASFVKKERLKQLRFLSPQESLKIFSDLARLWESSKSKSNSEIIDQIKIRYLIEQRKKMDRFATWKQGT